MINKTNRFHEIRSINPFHNLNLTYQISSNKKILKNVFLLNFVLKKYTGQKGKQLKIKTSVRFFLLILS